MLLKDISAVCLRAHGYGPYGFLLKPDWCNDTPAAEHLEDVCDPDDGGYMYGLRATNILDGLIYTVWHGDDSFRDITNPWHEDRSLLIVRRKGAAAQYVNAKVPPTLRHDTRDEFLRVLDNYISDPRPIWSDIYMDENPFFEHNEEAIQEDYFKDHDARLVRKRIGENVSSYIFEAISDLNVVDQDDVRETDAMVLDYISCECSDEFVAFIGAIGDVDIPRTNDIDEYKAVVASYCETLIDPANVYYYQARHLIGAPCHT